MTIHTTNCVTITGNGRGATPDEGDGELHYPTTQAALAALADEEDPQRSCSVQGAWQRCPRYVCGRDGHTWEAPRRCRCGGLIHLPGHTENYPVLSRACSRCLHIQDMAPTTGAIR